MKSLKQTLLRLLTLPLWAGAVLTVLVCLGLIVIFQNGWNTHPLALCLYPLSAYVLCADLVTFLPWLIRRSRQRRQRQNANPQGEKSLCQHLQKDVLINLGYGLVQVVQGVQTASSWTGSQGLYKIAHGFGFLLLAHCQRKVMSTDRPARRWELGWKYYFATGLALLGVNLTMSGIAFQAIWLGRITHHGPIAMIASAAYTFYKLTIAIVQVVQCWHKSEPILGASRNLAMTEALMSLFTLQTAMLTTFSTGAEDPLLMNSLTGLAVCLSTMLGGIGMMLHGKKKLLSGPAAVA